MRTTAERSSQSDISIHPIFCQHLAAYEYARQFVEDKIVLDVGCGEGGGTNLLADKAKKIIGVDYSDVAIKKARENYTSPTIEFICQDINRLKFENESFDIVLAFQLIEHLKKPDILLSSIKCWLKPEGIFIFSTPNRKASIVQHPYHFREYDKEELKSLLKKYFSQVDLSGLQFSPKVRAFREMRKSQSQSLLKIDPLKLHLLLPRFIKRKIFDFIASRMSEKIYLENRDLTEGIATNDYWITMQDIDLAIDLVGVCRK